MSTRAKKTPLGLGDVKSVTPIPTLTLRALEGERRETRETIDALYRDWERLAAELEVLEGLLE